MQKDAKNEIEKLNKELSLIQNKISMYNISLKDFEDYYSILKSAISSGLLKDPLSFALTLSNASVIINTDDDEYKKKEYMNDLENIIANEIRKSLDGNGSILVQELNSMQDTINLYTITIGQLCNYYEKLRLAMMAKIDNIDYLACVRILQNANVEPPRALDEHIKLNDIQNKLSRIAIKLNQQTKGNQKK